MTDFYTSDTLASTEPSPVWRGDPLSDALDLVRVEMTVMLRALFGAPWGLGIETHFGPAFHIVTVGACYLEIDGRSSSLRLSSGDLVILPVGQRHWLRDQADTPASSLQEILSCALPESRDPTPFGGPGPTTSMVCGGFTLQAWHAHPLKALLPPVIHIRGSAGELAPWVAATLDVLAAENASNAPGSRAVVNRTSELLLVQALRLTLAEIASGDTASLHGFRDPQIAAAIELIHHNPERPWTVGRLASEVALSRSAFAARFRRLLGESPMSYVTRTRLVQAASILRGTNLLMPEVAARAGYASQSSFSKAFNRAFGLPPGTYRGQEPISRRQPVIEDRHTRHT